MRGFVYAGGVLGRAAGSAGLQGRAVAGRGSRSMGVMADKRMERDGE